MAGDKVYNNDFSFACSADCNDADYKYYFLALSNLIEMPHYTSAVSVNITPVIGIPTETYVSCTNPDGSAAAIACSINAAKQRCPPGACCVDELDSWTIFDPNTGNSTAVCSYSCSYTCKIKTKTYGKIFI